MQNICPSTFGMLANKAEKTLYKRHSRANWKFNPHQNDQGRKGPCYFQRLNALKCLKCQKISKNI